MDSRFFRHSGLQQLRPFESTASAPSLRALEPLPVSINDTMARDDSGNVKVVVRVRQFIKREHDADARCIIQMEPKTESTTLLPPSSMDASEFSKRAKHVDERSFIFDKSFWSHDPTSAHYATQESVYDSFATDFLSHNFEGFHTCIFAYGQTGSGKSYTMMGTPEQPGLIPRYCEDLFRRIKEEPEDNTTYNVHVSYFEIYNEHVRDLLVHKASSRDQDRHFLKIRESRQDGVYVQGLTDSPVKCFTDVQRIMDLGDQNRTTAATKMNQTSSRSHAVFTITLKQIQHSLTNDETIERTARMRLVDLAGSERANKTEARGQRLVEGGKINKSLTTLGRVIAALADPRRQAAGATISGRSSPRPGSSHARTKSKSSMAGLEIVPYRDSVLTWLLKDSLGGNSKTAMVACISPSASDYDETLSTLRYADQAKRIRTRATANIDAVSAAERDAQIALMSETIKNLQLSVNHAHEKKLEEMEALDSYQAQVEKMQRLMEETRQVSDARIKAMAGELEALRPENLRMQGEIEALRRHLGLVVGELRNPIIIPPELVPHLEPEENSEAEGDEKGYSNWFSDEDKENAGANGYRQPRGHLVPGLEDDHESWAKDIHSEAEQMLQELGLFRRKVNEDRNRFLNRDHGILREVGVN
ncbi:hypothetical protein FKW77_000417 [Venturia effusa]|uniref:Kinesin-like protein n=1 Tax=Venturia effusa TaxID=50376 RepID=A0A517LN63_9PEZI|nr:hypothetical protein FKW77_000417 [Venturia effusa]